MSNTSIGRGPAHGSNENHDGDPRHTTLGEGASQDRPPAGGEAVDKAAPGLPAGVKGGKADPGVAEGPQSYPDGPNVAPSASELDAARGHPAKDER